MPLSSDRLLKLGRFVLISANVLVIAALAATAAFIRIESGWATPVFRDAEDAFRRGTIGTEVMPLPVAHVLPDLFPEHFLPGGKTNGDWIDQFGFLRGSDPRSEGERRTSRRICNQQLPSPIGRALARLLCGFSCALCHSTQLSEGSDQKGEIRYGPGSISLKLFARLDAFQAVWNANRFRRIARSIRPRPMLMRSTFRVCGSRSIILTSNTTTAISKTA